MNNLFYLLSKWYFLSLFFLTTTAYLLKNPNSTLQNIENIPSHSKSLFSGLFGEINYEDIEEYSQFRDKLLELASNLPIKIHNFTHLSQGFELCGNIRCEYLILQLNPNQNANKQTESLLFVSGMHGNQRLGPLSLLYYLEYLAELPIVERPSSNIIFFLIANPSGWSRKQRLSYPNLIDPNRDYPEFNEVLEPDLKSSVNQRKKFRTDSSLILFEIHKKWKICLSLVLHNGDESLTWNWGDEFHGNKSETEDEKILSAIGAGISAQAGKNTQIQMNPLKTGTMTAIVYPVKGGYEDWAYMLHRTDIGQCACLVFLAELGFFVHTSESQYGNRNWKLYSPNSDRIANGYISRGIRLISGFTQVFSPTIHIVIDNAQIWVRLIGCRIGILDLTLYLQGAKRQPLNYMRQKILKGTLDPTDSMEYPCCLSEAERSGWNKISEEGSVSTNKRYSYEAKVNCDPDWKEIGKSKFAQERQIKKNGVLIESGRKAEEEFAAFKKMLIFGSILFALILIITFIKVGNCHRVPIQKELSRMSNENMMEEVRSEAFTELDEKSEQKKLPHPDSGLI